MNTCQFEGCDAPTFAFMDPRFCTREHRAGVPLRTPSVGEQNARQLGVSYADVHDWGAEAYRMYREAA